MTRSRDRAIDWANLSTSALLGNATFYGVSVGIAYGLVQLALDGHAGSGHALELGLVFDALVGCLATLVLLGSRQLACRREVPASGARQRRRF